MTAFIDPDALTNMTKPRVKLIDHPGIQIVMVGDICEKIHIFKPKPHVRPKRWRGFTVNRDIPGDSHHTSSTFVEEAWAGWVVHRRYFQPPFEHLDKLAGNRWYYRRVGELLGMLKHHPVITYSEKNP